MNKIFKYPVRPGESFASIPGLIKVLDVQYQQSTNQGAMWCLVDTSQKDQLWRVSTYGTGHPCHSEASEYVGTYQEGCFVWHVFMEGYPS